MSKQIPTWRMFILANGLSVIILAGVCSAATWIVTEKLRRQNQALMENKGCPE